MCGFVGVLGFSDGYKGRIISTLKEMSQFILSRGPDSSGIWISDDFNVGFSHRRLSIVDTSDFGSQPMVASSGRYVIAFNGEIYNHASLRKKCSSFDPGFCWLGESDTESLLSSIDLFGLDETLNEITGMFAFSLWDNIKECMYLVRDRTGEKPLYYSKLGGGDGGPLVFGSNLQSLRKFPGFNNSISSAALSRFVALGYIPQPQTIYDDAYKISPGTYARFDSKGLLVSEVRYWDPCTSTRFSRPEPMKSDGQYINELDTILSQVIEQQMLADVPVGAFLSGGIDSSLIVGIMQHQSAIAVNSYSIGFEDRQFDESRYATSVASHIGTCHTNIILSSSDALSSLTSIVSAYDEPFADSSQIPTFLVSKLAKQDVTVSLTGDGGDELFGGYRRHVSFNRYSKLIFSLPLSARKVFSKLVSFIFLENTKLISILERSIGITRLEQKLVKLVEVANYSDFNDLYNRLLTNRNYKSEVLLTRFLDNVICAIAGLDHLGDSSLNMMMRDFVGYMSDDVLVKVDRAAMAVSLETRAPFLDRRVMDFALSLPFDLKIRKQQSKWILRNLLDQYVPRGLIDRPKAGFGIPLAAWLRLELKEYGIMSLNKEAISRQGFFNPVLVYRLWDEHQQGVDRSNELWPIIMFQQWLQLNHPEL